MIWSTSAVSKFLNLLLWAFSIHLVAKKGGDYVILISFGSTIWVITSMINESISKGLLSLLSFSLGQNNWRRVWRSIKSGVYLLFIIFILLGVPFLLFQNQLISLIIKAKLSMTTLYTLKQSCCWLWIMFILEGIAFLCVTLLLALKQTVYLLITSVFFSLIMIYLPYYISFQIYSLNPREIA